MEHALGGLELPPDVPFPTVDKQEKEVKLRIAVASVIIGASLAGTAQADEKLAQSKNCLACHQVDKKLVGPSYKDVAAKYGNDKDAEAKLVKKVREGGTGVWGQIPMPPNPAVSEAEAKTLVKWILAMKK
jgi:cytochrome c